MGKAEQTGRGALHGSAGPLQYILPKTTVQQKQTGQHTWTDAGKSEEMKYIIKKENQQDASRCRMKQQQSGNKSSTHSKNSVKTWETGSKTSILEGL